MIYTLVKGLFKVLFAIGLRLHVEGTEKRVSPPSVSPRSRYRQIAKPFTNV